MRRELQALFERHARDGRLDWEYETKLYCGRFVP
jgi:hypothetical protein